MLGYSRVLVAGGAGFIGCHTVDRFLDEGFEVFVLMGCLGFLVVYLCSSRGR